MRVQFLQFFLPLGGVLKNTGYQSACLREFFCIFIFFNHSWFVIEFFSERKSIVASSSSELDIDIQNCG